jgi:SAM-dependent methyltransferase
MWDKYFLGLSPNDGTVDFYFRVNGFLQKNHTVLDLGAGRAAWLEDINPYRRELRLLKGKCAKVVAADVDSVVMENKAVDERVHLKPGERLPFSDESFDLVIADYVLEHIDDPMAFCKEIKRILKPGGLFAARTPHKYCYVAVAARLVNNTRHLKVLKWVQPNRKEMDIFPTRYRMNTLKEIRGYFDSFEDFSFVFRADPAYFFGSMLLFRVQDYLHRSMPIFFAGNLFVFLKKM